MQPPEDPPVLEPATGDYLPEPRRCRLPSRFQLNDEVLSPYGRARVVGVIFTEGKVHYDLSTTLQTFYRIDSCDVRPVPDRSHLTVAK